MNIHELNGGRGTIPHYIAMAVPFTLITIWVIVALRRKDSAAHAQETRSAEAEAGGRTNPMWWPVTSLRKRYRAPRQRAEGLLPSKYPPSPASRAFEDAPNWEFRSLHD
jgi:hypothetical protein